MKNLFQDNIVFNSLKHHQGYVIERIRCVRSFEEFKNLINEIKIIGTSQMDFYFGKISIVQIYEFLIRYLLSIRVYNKQDYISWLKKEAEDYQLVKFPDQSIWTFRLGKEKQKFLHIHPARHSPLTTRVKAPTLKAAIAFLTLRSINPDIAFNVENINFIRKEYLNLSVIKAVSTMSEIRRCIDLLYFTF